MFLAGYDDKFPHLSSPEGNMRKLLTDHPASVGETYLEHMGHSAGFGTSLILAGIACLIHGLIPAWFVSTGSNTIRRLHDRMVVNRRRSQG
jgi:hypothetical protein